MIKQILKDKKQYLDLLLLADEQESMIDKYLEQGEMFALYSDNELNSVCVVLDVGNDTLEIKNIATAPKHQGQGYGQQLIRFIVDNYKSSYQTLIVGTGESPLTISFYKKCGFVESHRIRNFFVDNYDHPIYEDDVQLIDMVYLKMKL